MSKTSSLYSFTSILAYYQVANANGFDFELKSKFTAQFQFRP